MTEHRNRLNQPIGFPLPDWRGAPRPSRTPMQGRFCRLEPLDPARHADQLWDAIQLDRDGRNWTYLPVGPFDAAAAFRVWAETASVGDDPVFFAIVDQATGRAVGYASFMRIDPKNGVIEVGHINFTPALQKRPAATEAMFLMMRRVFDELGYRRYEWKCDSCNAPSRAAAARLGFAYEGLFRQAVVTKGRNRDTAWFSILDREWPALQIAFERWLAPENFAPDGSQRESLSALTKAALAPLRG
ncbi:MAG TPA: GNAT family protein [Candidatus Sulfotelmatobacter sp.]|nr:GNAT family protein [Candidatus Sulfotelmatobacter sp.]